MQFSGCAGRLFPRHAGQKHLSERIGKDNTQSKLLDKPVGINRKSRSGINPVGEDRDDLNIVQTKVRQRLPDQRKI